MKIWVYFWAYVYEVISLVDRAAGWLEYQVDNNDYLAGAIGAICLMAIPYLIGIIDIVWR